LNFEGKGGEKKEGSSEREKKASRPLFPDSLLMTCLVATSGVKGREKVRKRRERGENFGRWGSLISRSNLLRKEGRKEKRNIPRKKKRKERIGGWASEFGTHLH